MNLRKTWIVLLSLLLIVSVMGACEAMEGGVLHSGCVVASGEHSSSLAGANNITAIFKSMLPSLVMQSPLYLVWLLGAVIAIVRWPRHPSVSALVISAMVIGILTSLICVLIYSALNQGIISGGAMNFSWLYKAVGICSTILHAASLGLLLTAAFCWRNSELNTPRQLKGRNGDRSSY